MILTNCAACAASLAHDAPRCVRCKVRYCNSTCQHDHWRRGHKQMCKKIHRGGNAERYHADKKYKEAVAVAVEACAADTKGQTCYICMEGAVRRHTANEGLVRMCACRGTSGFAHVSCLARQVQILYDEAVENNLGAQALNNTWSRWYKCRLCEQEYHGVVRCALGWACWKAYCDRPQTEQAYCFAMDILADGLQVTTDREPTEAALEVFQSAMAIRQRVHPGHQLAILGTMASIANCLTCLGRTDEALPLQRDIYAGSLKVRGRAHTNTFWTGLEVVQSLIIVLRYREATKLLDEVVSMMKAAGRGEDDYNLMKARRMEAEILMEAVGATSDDLGQAIELLKQGHRRARRVLGPQHNVTTHWCTLLEVAVCKHALLESSPPAPRFAVGTRVECKVEGGWVRATVVNHYYHQPGAPPDLFYPYQIKLEHGGSADPRTEEGKIATWNGRLIFAPQDTDRCIRAIRRASRG